jgi:hypothetical protein
MEQLPQAVKQALRQLDAWELTMRAWPGALPINPASLGETLELLEHAIELAFH